MEKNSTTFKKNNGVNILHGVGSSTIHIFLVKYDPQNSQCVYKLRLDPNMACSQLNFENAVARELGPSAKWLQQQKAACEQPVPMEDVQVVEGETPEVFNPPQDHVVANKNIGWG